MDTVEVSVTLVLKLTPFGAYFCLSMVMITLSTVLACVVANMYFRGVRVNRAPPWMRSCIVNGLAKFFGLDASRPRTFEEDKAHIKKNWAAASIPKERSLNSENDFKMAKIRLLDNGVNSRMFAQPEVFETYERDYGYDSVPERDAQAVLLEEVRKIKDILLKNQEKRQREEEKNKYLREWRIIACITDRIFFIVYVTINVVTIVVLFCGM